MATCKGRKKDGTPCRSPIVLDNGYCRAHQDQAPEEPARWTRERLEAAIAAHGGPEGLDLAGADLSNLDLQGMDLRGIVLSRRDRESGTLISANLQGTILVDVNLQGADLRRANLQKAKLDLAKLQRARLEDANLQEASLISAELQGAILEFVNLQGADLGGTYLQGADLGKADLQDATLVNANLQRASLREANLQRATLWKANLQRARLEVADLQRVDLSEANLQEARLALADLREAGLEFARLQGASLRHVSLRGAYLRGANLQGADLQGADLREVDLLDIETGGLLGIKLYRAKLDHTLLKREQLGSAIGEEQAGEYRQARDAYLALKQNFDNLGDYAASAWAYQKERNMEKATKAPWRCRKYYGEEEPFPRSMQGLVGKLGPNLRQYGRLPRWSPLVWWFWLKYGGNWLVDWFVEVLCGYGESIGLVLWWMAVILFVSPLLFGLLGLLDWPDKNAESFHNLSVPWRYGYAYVQQFLYVLDAFTTANLAELQPANSFGRLCSGFIALFGIFLTGLLGFVAGNRIRRS